MGLARQSYRPRPCLTCLMKSESPEQTDLRGRFITTISGAKFYINEVNLEDIPIEDIAHALSMNCRFNGHVGKFYCVSPETKVLMYDLTWKCAGDLTTGDDLWGFDVDNNGHRKLRTWKKSTAISGDCETCARARPVSHRVASSKWSPLPGQ